MKEIIAALLTSGATLIAAWIMYSSKMNKIADQVEQIKSMIDKEGEKRLVEHKELSGEHKELSGEHKELSGEHKELSGEHKGLSGEHKDLSKEHRELKDEIHRVITYQESEKTAREMASKKMPDESGLVDMAKAVFRNNKKLQQENSKLNAKMILLQNENKKLKAQVMSYQSELENSREFDEMSFFDDSYDEQEF